MKLYLLLIVFFLEILGYEALQADDQQASAEDRMRQVLRDTMSQLRDAQNQVVTLQAAQTQSDQDKAALQAKVDALSAQLKSVGDQAASDKAASDKAIADLKSQVDDEKGQIDRLTEGLKEWKVAYNQTAQLAATSEAARKQFAMQAALLQRTVDDRETKNLALYKLGNEILTRYEQFGLGDATSPRRSRLSALTPGEARKPGPGLQEQASRPGDYVGRDHSSAPRTTDDARVRAASRSGGKAGEDERGGPGQARERDVDSGRRTAPEVSRESPVTSSGLRPPGQQVVRATSRERDVDSGRRNVGELRPHRESRFPCVCAQARSHTRATRCPGTRA